MKNSQVRLIIQEIVAIIVFILGVVFVSIPDKMLFIMPYITLFYFTVLFVVYLIPYIKNKTVKDLINLITYSLLLVGIIVFIFIPVDAIATVAFPMAAYCLVMGIRSLLSIKLSHITGKTDGTKQMEETVNSIKKSLFRWKYDKKRHGSFYFALWRSIIYG